MPLTFAGQKIYQPSPELRTWIEANFSLADIVEFPNFRHVEYDNDCIAARTWDSPRIKLNSLLWPWGASRFAYGHFLVSETSLTEIRKKLTTQAGAFNAGTLKIRDDTNNYTIQTDLYKLPAHPLVSNAGEECDDPLYLLTLVDQRYLWWDRSGSISITQGTTTWAQLIAAIGTILNVTITTDTIDSDYLNPSDALEQKYKRIPPLLDTVLWNIGHRLVRELDGTVKTQSATTALTSQDNQASKWTSLAGGRYAL